MAGLSRYFDHLELNGKFKNCDWAGLDLPGYGRTWARNGYDKFRNEINFLYDFSDHDGSITRAISFLKHKREYSKVVLMVNNF